MCSIVQGTIGSEPCPAGFATYSGSSPWGCCKGACPAGSEWEDAEALCFFQGSTASKGDISCATLVAAEKPNPPVSSTFEQSSESESVEISQATEESTEEAAVATKASQNESPAAEEVAEDAAEGSSLLLWLAVLAVAAAGGACDTNFCFCMVLLLILVCGAAGFCTAAPTVNRTAILMVGPPGGGKTTLFFTVSSNSSAPPIVMNFWCSSKMVQCTQGQPAHSKRTTQLLKFTRGKRWAWHSFA